MWCRCLAAALPGNARRRLRCRAWSAVSRAAPRRCRRPGCSTHTTSLLHAAIHVATSRCMFSGDASLQRQLNTYAVVSVAADILLSLMRVNLDRLLICCPGIAPRLAQPQPCAVAAGQPAWRPPQAQPSAQPASCHASRRPQQPCPALQLQARGAGLAASAIAAAVSSHSRPSPNTAVPEQTGVVQRTSCAIPGRQSGIVIAHRLSHRQRRLSAPLQHGRRRRRQPPPSR